MQRKKVGAAALVALVAFGSVLVSTGTASAVPLPKAVGSVGCKVSGAGKFAPKLTPAGTAVTILKTVFTGSSTGGCGGSAGIPNTAGTLTPVTITGAAFKGVGYYNGAPHPDSCPSFTTADVVGIIKVKIVWSSVPAIAPTVLTFTSGSSPVVSGSPTDTITLPSGATITATGSFSLPLPPAVISQLTNIVSTCSLTWGPYATYTFGPGSFLTV